MKTSRLTRSVWFAALLTLWLAGCATSPSQKAEVHAAMRIRPDPALLKVEPRSAEDRLPLQLALVMPTELPGGVTRLPGRPGLAAFYPTLKLDFAWQLETGLIAELAMMRTLSEALGGESNSLPSAPAPAAGYSGTLEMVWVQFDYDEQVLYRFPLGYIASGEFEARTRMAMQLSLLDAQGQQVWTRRYDDGLHTGIWGFPGGYAVRGGDVNWQAGVNSMAHDAAGRLAQRVLQDVREWHEAERLKPRSF